MKYSDKFFRFPVRLFLSKDINRKSDLEEKLGIEIENDEEQDPDYVTGWDCVDISDIRGFGTIFSRNRTLDDVRENGFDSTIVYLAYGREVGCSWPPDKFREKLNEFVSKVEKQNKEEEERKISQQALYISTEIQKAVDTIELSDIVQKPKKPSLFRRIWNKIKSF